MPGQFSGIYRGIVVNASDPLNAGRALVSVPMVHNEGGVWAMPCIAFGAPPNSGPRAGQEVWVMYENGDATRPVVLGKSR